MFGRNKKDDVGLLVKDVLVDLEKNPSRVDEMLERMVKEEHHDFNFGAQTFITATAMASPGVTDLERALRQMEIAHSEAMRRQQMAAMQNQGIGGFNGFSQQSNRTALGSFGWLFGPRS
jgi:hypothetical protein